MAQFESPVSFGVFEWFSASKLRLLAKGIRGDFTSAEAEAFLTLYQPALQARIEKTVKEFLQEKLS